MCVGSESSRAVALGLVPLQLTLTHTLSLQSQDLTECSPSSRPSKEVIAEPTDGSGTCDLSSTQDTPTRLRRPQERPAEGGLSGLWVTRPSIQTKQGTRPESRWGPWQIWPCNAITKKFFSGPRRPSNSTYRTPHYVVSKGQKQGPRSGDYLCSALHKSAQTKHRFAPRICADGSCKRQLKKKEKKKEGPLGGNRQARQKRR
ncbi:hypothetical protein BD289DRAFT_215628 [Coniella lustricola]|uniref:Uncharacterized protein n=1 Tax=Coniella lustricola TaxID=2025994 RepID=A0A2T2ZS30_9PEZI|nr:hypothetical protein BD289DRAFT_215628 [Coniella lustricola]